MISQGRYTLASSPTTTPKMLMPEIVLSILEEQANTISNKNKIKLVLRVLVYGFGFKKFISKEEINIHKIIQN